MVTICEFIDEVKLLNEAWPRGIPLDEYAGPRLRLLFAMWATSLVERTHEGRIRLSETGRESYMSDRWPLGWLVAVQGATNPC